MSEPTRILLIRHGQSTWNAEGRWQGRANPPLSTLGEDQARHASTRLAEVGPIDGIGSSTLQRAIQTSEFLAAGAEIALIGRFAGFDERSAGEWEGLTRAEIEEGYPGWLDADRRPDGYETDASIEARGSATLLELAVAHPGKRIAAVSHGGTIGTLERIGGDPWRRLANLEARWFEVTPDGFTPIGDRVHLLDDDDETNPPTPRGYA
ncbi:MAG: histidine phosphatase family protein [Actinomycetota bacterium]